MAIINSNSIESLVQTWLKAEEQGERFPVPFEDAWAIAGYSRKDSAKRTLESFLDADFDYSTEKRNNPGRGKPVEVIRLSCDAFTEFCMVSKTDVGKATRRYFIETANKWKLAKQHYPQVASEIEKLQMQLAIATQNNQANQATLAARQLDHTMLTLHGKETVLALRGMADQIVETEKPTIEVIDERYNVRFEGQTLVQIKDFVAKKYGIKFKSGADVKRFLEKKKCGDLIAQTPRSQLCDYVPKEHLETVYRLLCNDSRQLLIGE